MANDQTAPDLELFLKVKWLMVCQIYLNFFLYNLKMFAMAQSIT